jgi:hypothetical protein
VKRNLGLLLFLVLSGIIFFSACKKENNNVGIDIQPPNDRLAVEKIDTLTIVSYSQRVDSVKTDETTTSLLGSLNDPVFGTSTANIYTQFRLSQTATTFGENPVLDSLILTLDYVGIYGDTNALLTLEIYEMSEMIHLDSTYYSNNSVSYYPELIASKTFIPRVNDSVVVNEDTLRPHLRINLSEMNTTLADKLLNASEDDLNTQENFQGYFNGLYLKVSEVSSGGAITYLSLTSSLSEMVLFYSNDEEDSLAFPFLISNNAAYFGEFNQNYSVAQPIFQSQVLSGDTSLGKTTCYIQAMAGVKTVIKFPYLRNLYDNGKIAINEARLFIKLQQPEPMFDPPTSLVIVKSDGEGSYTVTVDQLEGLDYYGGIYDETSNGYWFRITTTIQGILSSDEPDYGFEMFLSGGSVNAQRCILSGSDPIAPVPMEDRMKLVITYTKVI